MSLKRTLSQTAYVGINYWRRSKADGRQDNESLTIYIEIKIYNKYICI